MDRLKQKLKKEKLALNTKEKCVADVKCIKENIKIREILRNVKMNSSMRLKAPTGSKVMNNMDFSDSEDCFEEMSKDENETFQQPPPAMNYNVIVTNPDYDISSDLNVARQEQTSTLDRYKSNSETNLVTTVKSMCNQHQEKKNESVKRSESMIPDVSALSEILNRLPATMGTRKTSLDHSYLSRRFTQSEMDLNTLGKSPLERKSSFFRKKMNSFLKNTTHLFRNHSSVGKNSKSLRSLNENNLENEDEVTDYSSTQEIMAVSKSDTSSTVTSACSSAMQSDQFLNISPQGSTSTLSIQNMSNSVNSLNEAYVQEAMLTPRAISMSSGLDSTSDKRGRKFKANRVTWLASEGLTNYFRRVIQAEKSKEKVISSYQENISCIPEYESYASSLNNMGRRLSYQRAVSGEDPVSHTKYQDTLPRRKQTVVKCEAHLDLQNHLAEFSKSGLPPLQGFTLTVIPETSFSYLKWSENAENLLLAYDWTTLDENEQKKQAVVRELVETEANYIQHLMVIVEIFIAAAHSLQESGKMMNVDTEKLFSNIPDLLNANLVFWNITFYPMVKDAVENKTPYNVELMAEGFSRFHEIFQPYEKYMSVQYKMTTYLRIMQNDPEFSLYLNWCYTNKSCNRYLHWDLHNSEIYSSFRFILQLIPSYSSVLKINACSSVVIQY